MHSFNFVGTEKHSTTATHTGTSICCIVSFPEFAVLFQSKTNFVHVTDNPPPAFIAVSKRTKCFFSQPSRRSTTGCQFCSECFHIPASHRIHEDHGVRETCLCPVWVTILPQGHHCQQQATTALPKIAFCHKFDLVYVHGVRLFHCPRFQLGLALQPFCGIAFNACWNVCHNMVHTGLTKDSVEGIRQRKGYNHRKVHATRTQPQGTRHILESAIRSCTFQLADTIAFSAFDDFSMSKFFSHNQDTTTSVSVFTPQFQRPKHCISIF